LKNTVKSKYLFILCSFYILLSSSLTADSSSLIAESPSIEIVYPKDGDTVHAVDSTFVFGHVNNLKRFSKKGKTIKGIIPEIHIENQVIQIHNDDGFLAWIPVSHGEWEIRAELVWKMLDDTVASVTRTVFVPEPLHTLPLDSLWVKQDYNPPAGNLVLQDGDLLQVSFWATPGCEAWFSIDSLLDSIPMAEIAPRQQPYWGGECLWCWRSP